jgi:long-chain acyl-CoA synthetase
VSTVNLGAKPRSLEFFAEHTPDRVALCEDGRALTWAEWNARADRVAEVLFTRGGVEPGERVALCMHNRIEWFVTQAAAAKLDASLVPVSARLTPAEIHYIVADSGARAFVFDAEDLAAVARVWTDEPPCEKRSAVRIAIGLRRSDRPEVSAFDEIAERGDRVIRFAPHAPRSIVYTSGTTGRPRGVVNGRAAQSSRPPQTSAADSSQVRAMQTPEPIRNLLGAPLNHAAGQASARATHAAGGCVYIMPKFDPDEALRIIDHERITTTFLVPTMLNRIVNLPQETLAAHDVSSIRTIVTGASPCPQSVKEQVIAYFGNHCLTESYGSTEVGLVSRMSPEDHLRKPGSCGRLLDRVEVRIEDAEGRALALGEIGEICVKTPGMIERYLNEGAPRELKDGFFSTGDVGRLDEAGYLYILDRKKDMIIAGGVNIYPAEIENSLRRHPAVLDAAVFGIPHPELGEQVKAVVECVDGRSVTEAELLRFVSQELASYKRPRSIDFVDEIPRNAAGKPLKTQLRAPHWAGTGKVI